MTNQVSSTNNKDESTNTKDESIDSLPLFLQNSETAASSSNPSHSGLASRHEPPPQQQHTPQQIDDITAVNQAWINSLAPSYDEDYKPAASVASKDSSQDSSSPPDCWRTTGGTPMTSRPHVLKGSTSYEHLLLQRQQQQEEEDHVSFPMKRVRSRSLGSSFDTHHSRISSPTIDAPWSGYQLLSSWTTEQCHVLATPQRSSAATAHRRRQLLLKRQQQQKEQLDEEDPNESIDLEPPPPLEAATNQQAPSMATPPAHHHAPPPRTVQSTTTTTRSSSSSVPPPNPLWISILYGLINATIVLPVLMSFASIIYREQVFQPYMPVLIKLTVASGIVHQVCFSTFSGLPFAVGQVQDAGLIFLSSMATTIAQHCQQHSAEQSSSDKSDAALLATVTVCLSLSTAVLGLGLMLIGQGGLAQYVQLLPTSVVGGYLAFIGWFCGMAGVGLMAGQSSVNFHEILGNGSWVFVLPGVLGGCLIYGAVRWLRHMAVLPVSILTLLALFYAVVWITGSSIADVTDQGWIRAMDEEPHWTSTWDYLRLDLVDWSVLPKLLLTELSMIFVVAMSSSLDVAAIELELKRPLDYNGELKMVGLSNLVSGLTGGYTGSYIFSQSIFSLRAGITSRAAGYVLALAQAVFFALPFPIMAYIPNFFFGSLLSMICVDLLYEWLWDVRHKVTPVEYMVCLVTFAAIQLLGVEFGILLGLVVYLICQRVGLRVGAEAPASKSDEEEDGQTQQDGLSEVSPLLSETQSYGAR